MTNNDRISDTALEALFEEARAHPPEAPDALLARVAADGVAQAPRPARRGLRDWFAAIGGLPALGGLVTATCVGFWIGVAPPAGLPDLAGEVIGQDIISAEEDALPELDGFGWDLGEG